MPGYENYEIKGDISKSTWQRLLSQKTGTAPAYIKDDADKTHYYEYSVTETEIKGYTTTIETSKDGFTFTIINRHFALASGYRRRGHYDVYHSRWPVVSVPALYRTQKETETDDVGKGSRVMREIWLRGELPP